MPENLYRTWCEVSLDAITHNLNEFKRIAPNAKIMAVVKATLTGTAFRKFQGLCGLGRMLWRWHL